MEEFVVPRDAWLFKYANPEVRVAALELDGA